LDDNEFSFENSRETSLKTGFKGAGFHKDFKSYEKVLDLISKEKKYIDSSYSLVNKVS